MDKTRTPAAEAEALENRMSRPEETRETHRQAYAEAATRGDTDIARLGSELAAEERPRDESETADAIKRAAENDTRV